MNSHEFRQFLAVVRERKHKQGLGEDDMTHIIVPEWTPDLQCCHWCGLQIRFGALLKKDRKPKSASPETMDPSRTTENSNSYGFL